MRQRILCTVTLKLFVCIFISMLGCVRNSPPSVLKGQELKGINGDAIYFLNQTGEVERVRKAEYNTLEFRIEIYRDTLRVNDDFTAYIRVYEKNFTLLIDSPVKDTIRGNTDPVIESFKFRIPHEGTYDFQGRLEYDGLVIPFRYRFIGLSK